MQKKVSKVYRQVSEVYWHIISDYFILIVQLEISEFGEAITKDDIEKMIREFGEDLDPSLVSDDEAIVPDLDSISEQFMANQYSVSLSANIKIGFDFR